jgi:uncharacterized protein (TIGR00730 family)
VDRAYVGEARRLGQLLGRAGVTVVYGGGRSGLMGAVADGALGTGGRVVGVIPKFMVELEWAHRGLSELRVVDSLHERKHLMVEGADGAIALPGGSGTFEELLEAITWKRLGLFTNPIVLVNLRGYFDPLLQMLERSVEERFMDRRHLEMWSVVREVERVLPAIVEAPDWSEDARRFAAV